MNERDKKLIEACNNDTLYDFISNYYKLLLFDSSLSNK
jgi:hypothetical protein